eukprot:1157689-Pelagomonas_calceolata.AAC.8
MSLMPRLPVTSSTLSCAPLLGGAASSLKLGMPFWRMTMWRLPDLISFMARSLQFLATSAGVPSGGADSEEHA